LPRGSRGAHNAPAGAAPSRKKHGAAPELARQPAPPNCHPRGSLKPMSENEGRPAAPDARGEEQLRRVVAEFEARLGEFAELAAHVRHEINNPLTGLIGQAQLLLREELSDTARRRVQTIEQLANRIRDTVASLREIQTPPKAARSGGGSLDGANEPPRH
jgi:signal transduction histidine kinase